MQKLLRKIFLASAGLALLLNIPVASASTKPTISSIGDKTRNSVTLKIKHTKHKSKRVDIVVKIRNKKTDKTTEQTFEDKRLDSKGKKSLKVEELDLNTKYSFRVKIRKNSGGDYSSWSDSLSGKTKN